LSRFSGEPMDAAAALACGLTNAVVPQGELRKRANDAAIALSKRPAGSLRETKRSMRDHQRIAAQIAEEGQLFKERLKIAEAREAFAAFAERRPPNFARLLAHPFRTIKARMGATHFLTKTLPKVAAEMALSVLAYNLTRVINIVGTKPLIAAIAA
jgi:Enoyl-CoA hydratase/isomerase